MPAVAAPKPRSPRIVALSRLGDEALAGRAAAGNGAAFSALYERYHGQLLGYCRSILLDEDDAHDATQNALEAALRSLPRREPGRPLRPWLLRIAHNESINIVRRRRPQAELTELDAPTVPGPEVDAEQRVRLAQLVDDLRGLPERQRGALVMRELSGLSYDEIAVALGVSPEAARRAVFDARTSLHDAVDGRATECRSVRHCISDGDRRSMRARRIRAHLRACPDCASFQHAIGARSADLHLLGPWLPGAALAGMLGGGAGGGALAAIGGGGGATVTVAGWSAIPTLVKGLTVAAVVATTGTAAVDMKRAPRAGEPAPRTHAAQAAGSPARVALPRSGAAPARAGSPARKRRTRAVRSERAAAGRLTAARATTPSTRPATAATTPAPAPVPAAVPQPAPAAPAPAATSSPQRTIDRLTDVRDQIAAALSEARAIAGAGTSGAMERARATLQTTLGSLGTTIDRVLRSAGLEPLGTTAAPAPSTTSSSSTLVAPVKQVLDEVDAVLSQLLARR